MLDLAKPTRLHVLVEVKSGLENKKIGRMDPLRWPSDTLYPQKLALTSPTSGGRSVGIVRSRTKAMELVEVKSVGQYVLVSVSHLELMTRFFFSVRQLWVSWCWAPSLTRGWVCNLLVQFILRLARAVTLGSKSLRTQDHILLSHLRLSQPGAGGSSPLVFISPRNRFACLF
jgi:hypothetical protein